MINYLIPDSRLSYVLFYGSRTVWQHFKPSSLYNVFQLTCLIVPVPGVRGHIYKTRKFVEARVDCRFIICRTFPFNMSYRCQVCARTFTKNRNLRRHEWTVNGRARYQCSVCGQSFTKRNAHQVHKRNIPQWRRGVRKSWGGTSVDCPRNANNNFNLIHVIIYIVYIVVVWYYIYFDTIVVTYIVTKTHSEEAKANCIHLRMYKIEQIWSTPFCQQIMPNCGFECRQDHHHHNIVIV
jgi:DNA-directed RNA polymerase subunit RPC12/RpoP